MILPSCDESTCDDKRAKSHIQGTLGVEQASEREDTSLHCWLRWSKLASMKRKDNFSEQLGHHDRTDSLPQLIGRAELPSQGEPDLLLHESTGPTVSRRNLLRGLLCAGTMPVILTSGASFAERKRDATSGPTPATYRNPLAVDIGDPYVLRLSGSSYWMYGTGGGEPESRTAFPTFHSSNLIDWQPLGETFERDPATSWCTEFFWAPEVYEVGGKFFMFYSAQWRHNPTGEKENFRIGVAVADKPSGPFKDIRNEPVFDPGYPIIDGDVLFDSDGKAYLYYSRCCYKHGVGSEVADWAKAKGWYSEIEESWIYGVELKPDFSGVIGEPVVILRPPVSFADVDALWENRSVLSHAVNRRWTEGPTAFRRGEFYYMMYSANSVFGPDYALGYATSKHPLGPFTKAANNPVAEKNTALGGDVTAPAHNCVTLSPDGTQMYCVYGARTSRKGQTIDHRVLFLQSMQISDKGVLTVSGPNDTEDLPAPS